MYKTQYPFILQRGKQSILDLWDKTCNFLRPTLILLCQPFFNHEYHPYLFPAQDGAFQHRQAQTFPLSFLYNFCRMKAILCTEYGNPDVLQLTEIDKPVPKNNEVLVKIYASTVTMGDCELRSLTLPLWTRIPMRIFMGYRKPKRYIPGMEFSGVVESVGNLADRFKPGDQVFGSCGFRMGANAEYNCYPQSYAIAHKPPGLRHEEVAPLMVGGINALHFLRKAHIQPGQKVLVIGAGGSIGSFAVQLARHYGAEVTAVDRTEKLEMLRGTGADHVVDYTKEDFSGSGRKYDVILDVVYQSSFSKCIRSLAPHGYYLMANPNPLKMFRALWASKTSHKKVIFEFASEKPEDLIYLASLLEKGIIKTVIDKRFPLEKTTEAHEYVQRGHKKGNVIITIVNEL